MLAGGLGFELLEHVHDAHHFLRVVAGLGHELYAACVGLRFVLAAVVELEHLVGHLCRGGFGVSVAVAAGADGNSRGDRLAELTFLHLLGRVPPDHVAGLMSEHSGELGLVLQAIEQPRVMKICPPGRAKALTVWASLSRW